MLEVTEWGFYCFVDFKASCYLSGNSIILNPVETVGNEVFELWLVSSVYAPEDYISENNEAFYSFSGLTKYHATTVDMAIGYTNDFNDPMYAKHTEPAEVLSLTADEATIEVFPTNIGEYAYYKFTLLHDAARADLTASQEIRIWFDVY